MAALDVPPVGERIRVARLERGVSLRGLARTVGVSASLVSQIETGKSQPSVSTLYAITTALGISVEELFDARTEPAGAPTPGPAVDGRASAGRTARPDGAGLPGGTAPAAGTGLPGGADLPDGTGADPQPAFSRRSTALDPPAAESRPAAGPDAAAAVLPTLPPDSPGTPAGTPGTPRGTPVMPADAGPRVGPVVRAGEHEALTLDSGVVWERLGRIPGTLVDFLRVTYAPGGSSSGTGALMRHPGDEYGYLLAGELTLTLGFDEYRLGPGDAVCFPSSTPHRYRNDGVEPAVGVWFVTDHPPL